MSNSVLKLFVTGRTRRSREAVRNLRSLLSTRLPAAYDLSVVDVLENPGQAEIDHILATPTLVKHGAEGTIRIIGDLANTEEVVELLGEKGSSEESAEDRKNEEDG
ncbi:MAG: circadian clock KaiB family protein [Spirochaetia bacterium]